MAARGFSQAELARRVGIKQPTIFRLLHGQHYGTKHIHRIARELGTTPAYLTGESDDPEADAPPPPELDSEARELLDRFATLSSPDRRALLHVARSMSNGPAAHGTVHSPAQIFSSETSR